MADIDSNEHRLHIVHGLRELHIEEITASLAIDLLQYVCRLGQVELLCVPARHYL